MLGKICWCRMAIVGVHKHSKSQRRADTRDSIGAQAIGNAVADIDLGLTE